MVLNERELLVVATKIVGFNEHDALEYMDEHHHKMGNSTYYRILGHVEGQTRNRLYAIAKGMRELHMQRIDELEKCRKEMWKQYRKECKDEENYKPVNAVRILKEIKELQPYISTYHEATRDILESTVKQYASEEHIRIPDPGSN